MRTGNVKVSTIIWKWCNDDGKPHRFKMPDSCFAPQGGVILLNPQHWVKSLVGKNKPNRGTGSETLSNEVTLFWNRRNHKLSVPLGVHNNIAMFQMVLRCDVFSAFCTKAVVDYEAEQVQPIRCHPAGAVSNAKDARDNEYVDSTKWKTPVMIDGAIHDVRHKIEGMLVL